VHAAVFAPCGVTQVLQVACAVDPREEAGLAIIATLDDVLRNAGEVDTGLPGHDRVLAMRVSSVSLSSPDTIGACRGCVSENTTLTKAMGISAGGITLLHAAHRQPDRIEAMVVIGAANHFPEQARAITHGARGNIPPAVRGFFDACASRGQVQVERLLQRFHGLKDNHEDVRLSREELAAIRARVLVVHGDRDEFFPVDIPVAKHAAIPDAQL
jgi:hypothetical protein